MVAESGAMSVGGKNLITKNQKLSLTCDRLGADLEGVCRHEGLAVFVPGALPGETLDALVVQVRPQYAFGKLLSLTTISPDRCEPFCPVYAQCGGCSGQHMRYEATLKAKRAQVLDCLNRIGGLNLSDADVPVTLGADDPLHGRNKTSLPVGGTPQNPMLGFYRRRSHDIIPITNCPVTMADLNPVIAVLRRWIRDCGVEPYREETHRGLLRHDFTYSTFWPQVGQNFVPGWSSAPQPLHLSDTVCAAPHSGQKRLPTLIGFPQAMQGVIAG